MFLANSLPFGKFPEDFHYRMEGNLFKEKRSLNLEKENEKFITEWFKC